MNEKEVCRRLRHTFSTSGWVLLLYYGIMNVAVMAVSFLITFINMMGMSTGSEEDINSALYAAAESGWGYIVTIAVGFLLLVLWKKKDFCFREIWKSDKPMRPGTFFALFALFFSTQAVVQLTTGITEYILNQFGHSLLDSLEQVSTTGTTLSMFLYSAILAPVSEEILFRGVVLRTLQPYGKKFSVFTSAFLFGIFHGNFLQTPYAFLVGLVLGYVTVEYSMGWAIFLHLMNNLVLVDMMNRLSAMLPTAVGNLLTLLFIWGCAIAAIVILLVKRREVVEYFRTKKMHPLCLNSFFTAPGVLTFTGFMVGSILLSFLLQLIS